MSTNRRTFTEEFKADAVQLVVQGARPIAQVARELEVNESSLGYWVKSSFACEHTLDRGGEVVVLDLQPRHPADLVERGDVSLQERPLRLRRVDPVHGAARVESLNLNM